MYKVFVSSTSKDLEPYRKAVLEAILKLDGFVPIAMENFGARDAAAIDFDDRKVRESDVLVGLLGHCYGSSPRDKPPSFTEREYDSATNVGIPRLMLVAPSQFLVPADLIESDEQRQRQEEFRRRVETDRVRDASFDSPAKLAGAVTTALSNWLRDKAADAPPEILPTVDTRGFVGRGWYLFQLKQRLIGKPRGPIAGVHGGPGFGKSALAAFFAGRYRDSYPDGIITVDRRQHTTAKSIADRFAALISQPVDEQREAGLSASEVMQTRFARRRCLLILDNADEGGIRGLTITGRSALLVTTRDRELLLSLGVPTDACIELKSLRPSEELTMLAKVIGRGRVSAERSAIRGLFEVVRGLPLALRIAAQTIATFHGPTAVNDYMLELREERASLLDSLSREADTDLNLRAIFQLSLRLMNTEQQATFACLSACAPSGFDRRSAAETAGYDDPRAANRHLSRLVNLGLLEHVPANDRFRFHPLILAFAQEQAARLSVGDAAESRYAEHIGRFVATRSRPSAENVRDLRGEQDAIFQVAEFRARNGHFDFGFLNGLNLLLDQTGQWAKGLELAELALAHPQWLDDRVAAVLHMQRGKHRARLKLSDQALQDLNRSLELNTKLGNEFGQAMVLNSRGGVRRDRGDLEGALADLDRAVAIWDKLGDERQQAMVLNSRGGVRRDRGDLEGALADLDRAVAISDKLGDERGAAMVLNSRGGVRRDRGDLEGALADLDRAVAIWDKLGDERQQAMVLNSRGGVRRDRGDLEGALADLDRAVAIWDKLGDERGAAMVLNSRGGVRRDRGDLEGALADLDRAVAIWDKLGDERQQAMVLNSRGTVKRDGGDFEAALEDLMQVRSVQKSMAHPVVSRKALNGRIKELRRVITDIDANPSEHREIETGFLFEIAVGLLKFKENVSPISLFHHILRLTVSKERKASCLFSLGKAHFRLGCYKLAIAYFKSAQQEGYDTSELWADLGRSLNEQDAPLAEVRAAFERAIENGSNVWAFSWYGLALSKEDMHEEAESLARRAVEKQEKNSALLNNLALVLMATRESSKLDEAIAILKKAVGLALPGFDWPQKNLESALQLQKELAKR